MFSSEGRTPGWNQVLSVQWSSQQACKEGGVFSFYKEMLGMEG